MMHTGELMPDGSIGVEGLGLVLAQVRVGWGLGGPGHTSAAGLLHCVLLGHCGLCGVYTASLPWVNLVAKA